MQPSMKASAKAGPAQGLELKQQVLPLSRGEKFALLKAAHFPALSRAETRNLRQLLEKIEAFALAGSRFSVKRLCDLCDLGPTALRRTIKHGSLLGVLAALGQSRSDGSTAANEYRVIWDALIALDRTVGSVDSSIADGSIALDRTVGSVDSSITDGSIALDRTVGSVDSSIADGSIEGGGVPNRKAPLPNRKAPLPNRKAPLPNRNPPLPNRNPFFPSLIPSWIPSLNSSSSFPLDDPLAWQEVEEELLACKVAMTHDCCSQARWRGVTSAEVLAMVAVYRSLPGAWGPGGLHLRVRSALPGADPAEGWPPQDGAYRRRIEKERVAIEDQHREQQRNAQRKEREDQERLEIARLLALEESHADALDAMTAQELAVLLGNVAPCWPAATARSSPLIRPLLLELLASNSLASNMKGVF